MKTTLKRIMAPLLALILCLGLVCCTASPEEPKEEPPAKEPDNGMLLARQGEALFSVLLPAEYDEVHANELEKLQDALEAEYGVRFRVYYNAESVGNAPEKYENVIFFGNTGATHECIERARSLVEDGAGFAVSAADNCIALYAHSERTLSDLTQLFISRYLGHGEKELYVERDVTLSRSFKDTDPELAPGYDHTLPVVNVNTGGKKITSLTEYLEARVSVSNTYKEYALDNSAAQIRGRGNGTWDTGVATKRPYRLKLDEKENLLGTGTSVSRDWVLLANSVDFTQMRNAIAFTLGRRVFTNLEYSTNHTFVNLYISGIYSGVYMICDQMEIGSGRISVKENPDSAEESEYLIELDSYAKEKRDENVRDVDYFKLWDKYWVIKSDYNSKTRCSYVKGVFEDAFDAIERGDTEEIMRLIDVKSCIDMYLLHEYCKNTDVGWSSFYIVLKDDGKLYFTAPWDFDLSSGNDNRVHNGSYEKLHAGNSKDIMDQSNPIFYKLMELDDFRYAVSLRWAELSDKADEAVLEVINTYAYPNADDMVRDIEAHYNRKASQNHSGASEGIFIFEDNLNFLKDWFAGRKDFMDGYFVP